MARPVPEINAASMADIAFLMLIFFLVTTTMDIDIGLARRLPPMPDSEVKPPPINRRNVLMVYVNLNDQLLVGNEVVDVSMLKEKVQDFIVNPDMSEKIDSTFKEGTFSVSKGVVSLNNDRGTSYDMYIKVQNELVKAFNELRDNFAIAQFGRSYTALPDDQQEIVRKVYPQNISEAEPRDKGRRNK